MMVNNRQLVRPIEGNYRGTNYEYSFIFYFYFQINRYIYLSGPKESGLAYRPNRSF